MAGSNCTRSFFRNDLQRGGLLQGQCPVKRCTVDVREHQAPFMRLEDRIRYAGYCPEHGIRIHQHTFVCSNGTSREELDRAARRNLMFQADYYLETFCRMPRGQSLWLCYENSGDAVIYNVFTELFVRREPLRTLMGHFTRSEITGDIQLYLWGGRVDLEDTDVQIYGPLQQVRARLEGDLKGYYTEPDVMLVVPGQVLIWIEAELGGRSPLATGGSATTDDEPRQREKLIERYCASNDLIDAETIIEFRGDSSRFSERLFRDLVFAASMAKLAGIEDWLVVYLRGEQERTLNHAEPQEMAVLWAVHSMLEPAYWNRFVTCAWEMPYHLCVAGRPELCNLAWYMENKTLNCRQAFNIS